jgi:hypothetical protein
MVIKKDDCQNGLNMGHKFFCFSIFWYLGVRILDVYSSVEIRITDKSFIQMVNFRQNWPSHFQTFGICTVQICPVFKRSAKLTILYIKGYKNIFFCKKWSSSFSNRSDFFNFERLSQNGFHSHLKTIY